MNNNMIINPLQINNKNIWITYFKYQMINSKYSYLRCLELEDQ